MSVRPRTLLGAIGVLRCALGERKKEDNNDMKRRNGVRAAYVAFLLRVLLLALGVLPSSIHWKKPIYGLPLFLAAAIWLVSDIKPIQRDRAANLWKESLERQL